MWSQHGNQGRLLQAAAPREFSAAGWDTHESQACGFLVATGCHRGTIGNSFSGAAAAS